MNAIFTTDWPQITTALTRVVVAYLLALPIGWEREQEEHAVGIRTFPLVAMASCGFVLLGVTLSKDDPAGTSRIIQGLITGIGFIGGGAILRGNGGGNGRITVHGTATAASIWNMGVMGAAVGQGRLDIGVVLVALNFLTLRVLAPWKRQLDQDGPDGRR